MALIVNCRWSGIKTAIDRTVGSVSRHNSHYLCAIATVARGLCLPVLSNGSKIYRLLDWYFSSFSYCSYGCQLETNFPCCLCNDTIVISEGKIVQGVAGGGRVLMWDRSVMVAFTLAT